MRPSLAAAVSIVLPRSIFGRFVDVLDHKIFHRSLALFQTQAQLLPQGRDQVGTIGWRGRGRAAFAAGTAFRYVVQVHIVVFLKPGPVHHVQRQGTGKEEGEVIHSHVLAGQVDIIRRLETGALKTFTTQGPGSVLAEIAQLVGRPALVDGRAQGPVEALMIPPDRFPYRSPTGW